MTYEPAQWAARTACTFAGAGPLSVAAVAMLLKDRTSRHLAAGLLPRELDPRDAARLLPLAPPRGRPPPGRRPAVAGRGSRPHHPREKPEPTP